MPKPYLDPPCLQPITCEGGWRVLSNHSFPTIKMPISICQLVYSFMVWAGTLGWEGGGGCGRRNDFLKH